MPRFEYKVVPAPRKGLRGKGIRGTEDRFANALQGLMNEHGENGWEYQRTDTLPCEERTGLTGKTTAFQNMLVFRRTRVEAVENDIDRPKRDEDAKLATTDHDQSHSAPKIKDVISEKRAKTASLGGVSKTESAKTVPVPDVAAQ